MEAMALYALGAVALGTGVADGPELAHHRYTRAKTIGEELGMRPLVAHCHFGLGKLYRQTGKPDQAREHITTAMTMYREMGMEFRMKQAADALTKKTRPDQVIE
jgi:hypothetical protein